MNLKIQKIYECIIKRNYIIKKFNNSTLPDVVDTKNILLYYIDYVWYNKINDPYLKEFVREFTKINNGNAYYSSLKGLGHLVFEDFKNNRTKNL